MADDLSRTSPAEPDPALSTTGGLPPDFFDEPELSTADRVARLVPTRDAPLPPRIPDALRPPRIVIDRRAQLPVVFVVIAGNILFFLAGGLAGWALARKSIGRAIPPAVAAPDPRLGEVARTIETKASKSEIGHLESGLAEVKRDVGTLGREFARLEGRLDAKPAASPAMPDLAPLQTKVEELVKESRKLVPLATTFHSLREHVEALDQRLNTVRAEVAAVPKQLEASLTPLKEDVATRSARDQVNPADGARNLGAALFREGKYAAARELFLRMVQDVADDARLWYFAALANGLTSGDWGGETERMVRRGLACEKGGSPKRAEIDAQFAGLTREQGKDWLSDWRERARAR